MFEETECSPCFFFMADIASEAYQILFKYKYSSKYYIKKSIHI